MILCNIPEVQRSVMILCNIPEVQRSVMTMCNIPEVQRPQQHCGKSLKPCVVVSSFFILYFIPYIYIYIYIYIFMYSLKIAELSRNVQEMFI